MEGDFILQSIAEQGRAANEAFERKLKAVAPLEVLLECPDDADELAKCMENMERQFTPAENPWTSEKFTPADEPVLSIAELEKRYSAPENLWSKAAKPEPAAEHQDEEQDEPEIIPDRATRFERQVRNMKACVLSKMQEGKSRDAAVAELLKIAGNNTYSRQIIREAEAQSPDA